jgi:hypothetical protein
LAFAALKLTSLHSLEIALLDDPDMFIKIDAANAVGNLGFSFKDSAAQRFFVPLDPRKTPAGCLLFVLSQIVNRNNVYSHKTAPNHRIDGSQDPRPSSGR